MTLFPVVQNGEKVIYELFHVHMSLYSINAAQYVVRGRHQKAAVRETRILRVGVM